MRSALVGRAAFALSLVALAGCGGSGGSSVSPAVPSTSPSPANGGGFTPATANVTIVIPAAAGASAARRGFVSPNTQSVSIQLISVGGQAVSSLPVTIETYPGAPGCTTSSTGTSCTANITAGVGADVFNVSAFSGANGAGSTLASGTFAANVASAGNSATLSSTTTVSIGGVVANVSMVLVPPSIQIGTAASFQLTVTATDASGATIIGPAPFASPILLATSDTSGAVGFIPTAGASPSPTLALTSPATVALSYNGATTLSPGVLSLSAKSGAITSSAQVPVVTAPATPPPSLLYVLNNAGPGKFGGAVTEYAPNASGNVKPINTIALDAGNYPVGMAVDPSGNVYVGYYTGIQTFASNPLNFIDVYGRGASTVKCKINSDSSTQTQFDSGTLYADSKGDLLTIGMSNVQNNYGYQFNILLYSNASSCPISPVDNFSPTGAAPPYYSQYTSYGDFYVDSSSNVYWSGPIANYLQYWGVIVSDNSYASGKIAPPVNRAIVMAPNSQDQGFAVDPSSGKIYVATLGTVPSAGSINVYAAGTGSSASNTPLYTVSDSTHLIVASLSNSVFSGVYPELPMAILGSSLYVANESTNSIIVYTIGSNGNLTYSTTITGSNTGLSGPMHIVIGPNPSATGVAARRRSVR